MGDEFQAINNFLVALRARKGPDGRIPMDAEYQPEEWSARGGSFTSRCSRDVGTRRKKSAKSQGDRSRESSEYDGILYIGESVRFSVKGHPGGYLSLFNFGSGGSCEKLFPRPSSRPGFLAVDSEFFLPPNGSWFRVAGPATRTSGQPDRLLALILREPLSLTVTDLDPRLVQRTTSRDPGFGGAPKLVSSTLFSLGVEAWEYGLLEYETR